MNVGGTVPEFEAPDQHGDVVRLVDLLDVSPVVLFFYPKEFDEANNLGFPLLSDADKEISAIFGAKRFGPMPSKRMTFVIDTDRTVLAAIKSETNMDAHADDALAALADRG